MILLGSCVSERALDNSINGTTSFRPLTTSNTPMLVVEICSKKTRAGRLRASAGEGHEREGAGAGAGAGARGVIVLRA